MKTSMDGEFELRLIDVPMYPESKQLEGEWTPENNKGANSDLEK